MGDTSSPLISCPLERSYHSKDGNEFYGSLNTDSGPKGSSYTTRPVSFMRWISWGISEANPGPRIRTISATCTMPRSRNSATILSCVGSYIAPSSCAFFVKSVGGKYTQLTGAWEAHYCRWQLL